MTIRSPKSALLPRAVGAAMSGLLVMSVLLAPGTALAAPGGPPRPQPDTITTIEDTPTTGNVLTNDDNLGDLPLHVVASGPLSPTVGTLDIAPDGAYTFTPAPDWFGNASTSYDVSNDVHTRTATIDIVVTGTSDPPTAVDDTIAVSEDTPTDVTASILANDSDPDGDTLAVTAVTNATGGSVDLVAGTVTFTPDANACGTGLGGFDYTISDGTGFFDSAHATIALTCVDDAPVAVDDGASGTEDTDVVIDGADLVTNDTDLEGDSLSVSAVSNPTGGTVELDAGAVTFTPDSNWCGTGGFDYTVSDGNGGSDIGHVTVDISCVNDDPVANDDSVPMTEDDPAADVTSTILGNDTDAENDTLTITDVGNATGGSAVLDAGAVTFTPDANWCGTGGFDYDISDGNSGVDTGHVTIEISCVNDDPVATDDSANGTEDTDLVIDAADLVSNDSDAEDDSLDVASVDNATGGSVELDAGTITFSPDLNACGTGAGGFDYIVADGNGGSDTGHVTIDLSCEDDSPVANDDTANGTEDTDAVIDAADLTANDTDLENDTLTVTDVGNPTSGTVVLDSGTVTFTPAANWCGTGGFDYTVSDGNGGSDDAHVTVNLECVNDDPVANDDTVTVGEDSGPNDITTSVLGNDTDPEDDALVFTGISNPSGGSVDVEADSVSFTPDADVCGPAKGGFDYDISDGNTGSDTGHVTIDITCAGDPPVAFDDGASGAEDENVVIDGADLTSNDTDADGDPLSVTDVGDATGGSVALDAGTVTFTPETNLCGDGVGGFDYTVSDGDGNTDIGHVTVDLNCVNDDPVAADDGASGTEDENVVIDAAVLMTNDTDAEDDDLSVTDVGNASGGSVELDAGEITFIPDADNCGPGAAGFDYTVSDGNGGTGTGHVSIDLACENDAPVANDDDVDLTQDDPATDVTTRLLENDSDVDDGDTLTIDSVSNASGGSVELDEGTVTFTPEADLCGVAAASFDYEVSDGNGGFDSAHVLVDLTCTNVPPVAVDDGFNGTEDTDVGIHAADLVGNDTDADDDTLTVQSLSDVTGGEAALDAGEITFSPDADLCGDGAGGFDYVVSDGNGGLDTGHVTIDLTCVNDPPVTVDDTAIVPGGSGPASYDVLDNDSDPEGDSISLVSASVDAGSGTASIDSGMVVFAPAGPFEGIAVITYTITDGDKTADGTLTVTVGPDVSPPVANAPTVAFGKGRVDQAARLKVSWSAVDVGVGVASYEVQLSKNGHSFRTIYSGPATSATAYYGINKSYRWRVRATDKLGHVSGWATSATHRLAAYQNGGGIVRYHGDWHGVGTSRASGNGYAWTTVHGARVGLTFTGASVLYVGTKSTAGGKAKVYVDNVLVGRYSLHLSHTGFGRIIARKAFGTSGRHRIRVVNDQAHFRTTFDVFLVLK